MRRARGGQVAHVGKRAGDAGKRRGCRAVGAGVADDLRDTGVLCIDAVHIAQAVDGNSGGTLETGQHRRLRAAHRNQKDRGAPFVLHIDVAGRIRGHGGGNHAGDRRCLGVGACCRRREFIHRARALVGDVDIAGWIDRERNGIGKARGDRRLLVNRARNERELVDGRVGRRALYVGDIHVACRIGGDGLRRGCTA